MSASARAALTTASWLAGGVGCRAEQQYRGLKIVGILCVVRVSLLHLHDRRGCDRSGHGRRTPAWRPPASAVQHRDLSVAPPG